jgi:hypothetical protein
MADFTGEKLTGSQLTDVGLAGTQFGHECLGPRPAVLGSSIRIRPQRRGTDDEQPV